MNYINRLVVLAMVGAFGITQAAPVVVTPGSVAKYVYLPKAAVAATAGGGTSAAGAAQLAAQRETLSYCITSSRTIAVDPGFKGTIQAILIGGGGGGGSQGGRPNGATPGGPGNSGSDGTATTLTINGTLYTAPGGKGGKGGGAGRLISQGASPGGDGGDGGLGGIGGYTFINNQASNWDVSTAAVSGVTSPYASVNGSAAFPTAGGQSWSYSYSGGWVANAAAAGRYGANWNALFYTTGGFPVANPSMGAGTSAVPKYLRCDAVGSLYSTVALSSPVLWGAGVGGGGGSWAIYGPNTNVGGGGGGGSGGLKPLEVKYVSGDLVAVIGVGGAVGPNPGTDFYISPTGYGDTYVMAKPGSNGAIILRLIPD